MIAVTARHLRVALWTALLLTWPVMLWFAWDAFSTFPTAERLEQSRMARIPTFRSLLMLAGRSAAEIAALLLVLWPRAGVFARRLGVAVGGLAIYFIMTAPLAMSSVTWVHRRWLALLVVTCLSALVLLLGARAVRRLRRH